MTLEDQLRVSIIHVDLLKLAASMSGKKAEIVRYAARVLSLLR